MQDLNCQIALKIYNKPYFTIRNGLFGKTSRGNYYKPISYHNPSGLSNRHKNKWSIRQDEQYYVFKLADESVWNCSNNDGSLFAIIQDGKIVLGALGEVLGYFEVPVNNGDPWHGYPIFSSEFELGEDLLDKWEQDKIVSPIIRKKIGKGQI